MKKQLLIAAFATSSLAVLAQGNLDKKSSIEVPVLNNQLEMQEVPMSAPIIRSNHSPESTNNVVLWSENFASGIPSTWTNAGAPAAALWEYRGPNTTPNVSSGSRGAFSGINNAPPSNTPILSPTAANGFIIFDSDYLDNLGSQAQMGNGPAPAPHTGNLTTGTINLSGQPDVKLEWNEYYRSFNSRMIVLASTDGGITFPDTLFNRSATGGTHTYTGNQAGARDAVISLNVSNRIGGQANVRLRFQVAPDARAGANGNNYYFWMLDDIKITQTPNNDLELQDFGFSNVGKEYHYGFTPASHVSPINFTFAYQNAGRVAQTNTRGVATISLFGAPFATVSTPSIVLAPLARDTATTTNFSPIANLPQEYGVNLRVASDSVTTTSVFNNFNSTIRTTDSIYSLDYNSNLVTSLGTTSFADITDGLQLANHIEILTADTLNAVSFTMSNLNRRVGAGVLVSVYDTANIGTWFTTSTLPPVLMQSDFYTITAADSINRTVVVDIPEILNFIPQDRRLAPGQYIVAVELFSNNNANNIAILDDIAVDQEAFAGIIYFPGNASNTPRWYTNGNAFFIRSHLNKPRGVNVVNHNAFNGKVSVFPNPAQNVAYFRYELEQPSTVSVIVRDIAGKEVFRSNEGTKVSGTQQFELNTSNYANGMYLYELNANGNRATGKFIVTNK